MVAPISAFVRRLGSTQHDIRIASRHDLLEGLVAGGEDRGNRRAGGATSVFGSVGSLHDQTQHLLVIVANAVIINNLVVNHYDNDDVTGQANLCRPLAGEQRN